MNNGTDVSSWLLIEDSADSEGDSGLFSLCPCNIVANIGHNEDDAESCTCDTVGMCGLLEDGEGHEDEKGCGEGCGEFCGDEYESCDSDWSMSDAVLEIECSSPLVGTEDEVETRIVKVNVNDVEDKMFWEICMAVGYP